MLGEIQCFSISISFFGFVLLVKEHDYFSTYSVRVLTNV